MARRECIDLTLIDSLLLETIEVRGPYRPCTYPLSSFGLIVGKRLIAPRVSMLLSGGL